MNVSQLKLLSSAVVLSSVLVGCNQYEISKDSQGRTIRLNKSTGDVTVIEGGKLIVPKSEDQVKAESEAEEAKNKAESAKLSEKREWPVKQLLGTKATCTTIYINGALRYKVLFGKKPRGYTGDDGQSFDLLFLKDGIKVYEGRAEVLTVIDSGGEETTIRLSGDINMNEEDYKVLDGFSVVWRGL